VDSDTHPDTDANQNAGADSDTYADTGLNTDSYNQSYQGVQGRIANTCGEPFGDRTTNAYAGACGE